MAGESVLVFGATGAVGGAAAQEAAERGSKVWLAVRDTNKPISWLTKEKEEDGTYTKIQADLTDPATVTEAVKKSGAKSAFVYLVHGASSRPAFEALKGAGVTWVVLLSSFTVEGDLTKYEPDTFIPYHHAKGELDLRDVGIAYGAVRPGFFASNINFWYVPKYKSKGETKMVWPDEVKYDWIVPKNIGQVAGALLTQPKPDLKPTEPEIVYVIGPEFISMTEVGDKLAKAMGLDAKVKAVSVEDYFQDMEADGTPNLMVKYLVDQARSVKDGEYYEARGGAAQAKNIEKYTGKKPITFDEYLESVKSSL